MIRTSLLVSLALTLLGPSVPTWAQATRTISTQVARGDTTLVTIDLFKGHGVTLNFRPADTVIRRAWLDDPSQVTLDFDDAGCATIAEACAATIIHLRRIEPLSFSGLPATETTTLTVVTDQDLFTFQLAFPNSGAPSYRILEIQPETLPTIPTRIAGSIGVRQVERGLLVAQQQNLVATDEPLWGRIQDFLDRLEQGIPMPEAAQAAGISDSLVLRLVELGR